MKDNPIVKEKVTGVSHKKGIASFILASLALILSDSCAAAPSFFTDQDDNAIVAGVTIVDLRCEYLDNPLGIDVLKPRLSWKMKSSRRDGQQIAYRLIVASSREMLARGNGDLWDTGKVYSGQSIQMEYGGKPLESGMHCYWKVCIWDNAGRRSAWSHQANWTMGLLKPSDWQAVWIKAAGVDKINSPAPWVRKDFQINASPDHAMAYVNVMGFFEFYVNGQKAGEDVLSPAISDLTGRSFYRAYDISRFLHQGSNCVGLWMDKGWNRSGPVARVQIEILAGGKSRRICTDSTWMSSSGPIVALGDWKWDGMGGERFDARKDIEDWSDPGCIEGEWMPVQEIPAPQVIAAAQMCPPNRIGEVIPLLSSRALGPKTWELDFGTNLTGWMQLRLPKLKSGDQVVMHYADRRFQSSSGDSTPAGKIGATSVHTFDTPDGAVSYQTFNQTDEFISAGKSGEKFSSKFNYHGFRYVIIEGLDVRPLPGDAEALLIESDLETTGSFECSNELLNRISRINLWTLRCLDLGGYMVDCPHRERLGYGDGQVSIETMVMNHNAAAFYGKWAVDWIGAQNPSTGEIAHTAPKLGGGGGPGWGGAGCILPWKLYLYYGDRRLLEQSCELMRRYITFLESKCINGVLRYYGGEWDFIGDWVPPGRGMDTNNWPSKPAAELFNNCYLIYLWEHLAKAEDALGRPDKATLCRKRIREISPRIHKAFYDENQKLYVLNEQSYQLMPLMTGVVPNDLQAAIMQKLEECILLKNKGHLDTGMLGTYFLVRYLQEIGRNDLLFTIINQDTYPGWGYMLSQGATTLWEQWNGYWSQIHSCFTSPGGWFYQGLAGILADESAPGFKKIIIRPAIVGDITWVRCSYQSIYGLIVSNWQRKGPWLSMELTIPENTTATVFVPAKDADSVSESGIPATDAEGVRFLRTENGVAVFLLGSGTFRFRSAI